MVTRCGRGAAVASFLVAGICAPALAGDVTLTARTGDLRIEGALLGYDGRFYRIETPYGEVTVDGAGVECDGAACPDPDAFVPDLRISGAGSVLERAFPALIETFARRAGYGLTRLPPEGRDVAYEFRDRAGGQALGRVTLRPSTSAEGFADLIADEADLAVSLRDVTPGEADLARLAGGGDLGEVGRSRILALDGLVPIVSVSNPVGRIALDDLRAIARGRIADWSDLGAGSGPIALHLREPTSGLTEAFRHRVMGATDAAFPAATTFHETDQDLAAAVAADPLALGVAAFSGVGNAQIVDLEGPCGITARADEASLKTQDYPLTAPIFLYRPMRRLPTLSREFLDYVTSPAAQPVIDRAGYVDQFPRVIPVSDQGDRLANAILRAGPEVSLVELQRMIAGLAGRGRLSISFRFEGGSSELDAQSRSNVALLAKALERGVFDGRTLVFAGFSDGQGPAGTNRRLSGSRANAVRDAVRNATRPRDPDRLALEVAAYGEAMPMACDETGWGRQVNRRVEVWLD